MLNLLKRPKPLAAVTVAFAILLVLACGTVTTNTNNELAQQSVQPTQRIEDVAPPTLPRSYVNSNPPTQVAESPTITPSINVQEAIIGRWVGEEAWGKPGWLSPEYRFDYNTVDFYEDVLIVYNDSGTGSGEPFLYEFIEDDLIRLYYPPGQMIIGAKPRHIRVSMPTSDTIQLTLYDTKERESSREGAVLTRTEYKPILSTNGWLLEEEIIGVWQELGTDNRIEFFDNGIYTRYDSGSAPNYWDGYEIVGPYRMRNLGRVPHTNQFSYSGSATIAKPAEGLLVVFSGEFGFHSGNYTLILVRSDSPRESFHDLDGSIVGEWTVDNERIWPSFYIEESGRYRDYIRGSWVFSDTGQLTVTDLHKNQINATYLVTEPYSLTINVGDHLSEMLALITSEDFLLILKPDSPRLWGLSLSRVTDVPKED